MNYVTKYKEKHNPAIYCYKPDNFVGYELRYYVTLTGMKLWNILEYDNNKQIGYIKLAPFKLSKISYVVYNNNHTNYSQLRYNNNNIRHVFNSYQNLMYGESRKYNTDGSFNCIEYYYNDKDITEDVLKMTQYKGNKENFINYKMSDCEIFNIQLKYGSYFKFYDEYNINFNPDSILKYCLSK